MRVEGQYVAYLPCAGGVGRSGRASTQPCRGKRTLSAAAAEAAVAFEASWKGQLCILETLVTVHNLRYMYLL